MFRIGYSGKISKTWTTVSILNNKAILSFPEQFFQIPMKRLYFLKIAEMLINTHDMKFSNDADALPSSE